MGVLMLDGVGETWCTGATQRPPLLLEQGTSGGVGFLLQGNERTLYRIATSQLEVSSLSFLCTIYLPETLTM